VAAEEYRRHGAQGPGVSVTEMPTDPIYVAARSVLLDALGALGDYRSAVVIVGAQAVYLQTGDAGLSVAPFTRDGDVALDPGPLLAAESPLLGEVMAAAGFALRINTHGGVDPGTWMKTTTVGTAEFSVPVDLIVPLGALPAPAGQDAGCSTRGARKDRGDADPRPRGRPGRPAGPHGAGSRTG